MDSVLSGLTRLSLAGQVSFSISQSIRKGIGKTTKRFILGLDHHDFSDRLAMTSAEDNVLLYECSKLTLSQTLKCNNGSSGLSHPHFGTTNPEHLYAASYDGAVMMWDIRASNLNAVSFSSESLTSLNLNFLSLDINCDDSLLAVGSSATEGGDAFIGFWDIRMSDSGFMGVYEECHSDDINALSFHPSQKSLLLSGSSDGLICKLDLMAKDEDEALILTCNPDRSVARVGWDQGDGMWCISDMETFHTWDNSGDSQIEVLELPDESACIVECLDSPLLLLGDQSGNLSVWDGKKRKEILQLSGGHSELVRCAVRISGGSMVTGGEDGRLCSWQPDQRKSGSKIGKRHKIEEEKGVTKKLKTT